MSKRNNNVMGRFFFLYRIIVIVAISSNRIENNNIPPFSNLTQTNFYIFNYCKLIHLTPLCIIGLYSGYINSLKIYKLCIIIQKNVPKYKFRYVQKETSIDLIAFVSFLAEHCLYIFYSLSWKVSRNNSFWRFRSPYTNGFNE